MHLRLLGQYGLLVSLDSLSIGRLEVFCFVGRLEASRGSSETARLIVFNVVPKTLESVEIITLCAAFSLKYLAEEAAAPQANRIAGDGAPLGKQSAAEPELGEPAASANELEH